MANPASRKKTCFSPNKRKQQFNVMRLLASYDNEIHNNKFYNFIWPNCFYIRRKIFTIWDLASNKLASFVQDCTSKLAVNEHLHIFDIFLQKDFETHFYFLFHYYCIIVVYHGISNTPMSVASLKYTKLAIVLFMQWNHCLRVNIKDA